MPQDIYLLSTLQLSQLEEVIEAHKEDFENFLDDNFTENDLNLFEKQIDQLAAITVQPVLTELTFDDFYADPEKEEQQRSFFSRCKSSVSLENLPFLETNPFQVYYLRELLKRFPEVLIDRGGVNELMFKESYLNTLAKFKDASSLIVLTEKKAPVEIKTSKPVEPIDFLILDVYKELTRLQGTELSVEELSPKIQKIFHVMKEENLDSTQLLRRVGLNAKDFDDGLERLKFWLRKL